MKDYYFECCKECENLFHCYGCKVAEDIQSQNTDLYLLDENCINFYPEIKQ